MAIANPSDNARQLDCAIFDVAFERFPLEVATDSCEARGQLNVFDPANVRIVFALDGALSADGENVAKAMLPCPVMISK